MATCLFEEAERGVLIGILFRKEHKYSAINLTIYRL